MTPKEKAEELVNKFKPHSHFWVHDFGSQKDYDIEKLENAKQCALIAVEEIQELIETTNIEEQDYWYDVKFEINNL